MRIDKTIKQTKLYVLSNQKIRHSSFFCRHLYPFISLNFQIEIETVDRTGTFLGSLWESKTNMAAVLLEAGLAKFQKSFGTDRIADAHLLAQAEESAKCQKLKVSNA